MAVASATATAQFNGLATPSDGSTVYFTTSLRIKGTTQPNHGKLFAADETGVRLVASRERVDPPADNTGVCRLGSLYAFRWAEVTADGKTIAAQGFRSSTGLCRSSLSGTTIIGPSSERDYQGRLRLSANGRYAIVDTTASVFSAPTVTVLDLQTGQQKDLALPSVPGGITFALAGRTIADDGTAIVANSSRAYLIRPGGEVQPFPVDMYAPLAIAVDGARVLYLTGDLHIRDLRTGEDRVIAAGPVGGVGLSDDGSRAAYIREDAQVYIDELRVTNVPEGIASAVLSGNGKIVYAVTKINRLLKIMADTGETDELIGRTPDILSSGAVVDAGMFTTIVGAGFSESTSTAPIPLPDSLGGVSVRIAGRRVPIGRVTPTQIDAQVPWDMPSNADLSVVVDAQAVHSPFETPESTIRAFNDSRAGAIAHQNWDSLVTPANWPHTGEIIHVWAVGLGPVQPEPAPGDVAPSAEPFSRLVQPMTCANSEVLYAGLAPGWVARIYQVDLRLGSVAGYQQITCTIGGRPIAFLTLNILP